MTKVKVDPAQLMCKVQVGLLGVLVGKDRAAEKSDHSVNICQHSVPQRRPLRSSDRGFRGRGDVQVGFKRKLDFKIEQHPSFIFSLAPMCASPYQMP